MKMSHEDDSRCHTRGESQGMCNTNNGESQGMHNTNRGESQRMHNTNRGESQRVMVLGEDQAEAENHSVDQKDNSKNN